MLTISLLTPFSLQQDEQALTLTSRRTEALFVYLLRRGKSQARDVLANLFWDDLSQTQATGNLRVLIANLHKAVGPHVTITRQSVAFDLKSDFYCDLTVLEQALTEARSQQADGLSQANAKKLAQALDSYRGELLPGFYLRGGQQFDEWLATEREWLRTRVIETLSDLTNTFLSLGDYRAGIEQAQRLVKLDPLREEGHQQLMQLLAADGQTGAALAHYHRCVQLLNAEMGAPPSPATTQLFQQIQRGERQSPTPLAHVHHVAPPIAHNLPRPMLPFVGRESELARLSHLLNAPVTPLITLVGEGGMGKTALAIEAMRRLLEAHIYQDGIFLVPLAAISEVAAIPVAIAAAIGYRFQKEGGDERTQLLAHLKRQSLLLLLDNFEHLLSEDDLDNANDLIQEILQAAPQVRLLITSRYTLNCPGENVLRLDGLDLPTDNSLNTSAVQLFVQSVHRTHGSSNFLASDLAAIARICHLLQGMPLAILLAASWVETHTFAEIAAEIEQNIGTLVATHHHLPERQRSMTAVFDYSWRLLSADEQRIFARMSIFRAGCTRSVAQLVTGGSSQHLLALEHKSRIQRDLSSGRFSIHELLRQVATTKLADMGEAAPPLHVRAVESIEKLYEQDLAPYVSELAYHAEQAGLIDKACHYLRLTAEGAQNAYQNSRAIEAYSQALVLTPPADKEAQFQVRMARQELHHLLGNREQQASELEALHGLAIELEDLSKQIEVYLYQAHYAEALGHYADAAHAAQSAVALAERLESVEYMARSNLAWGVALRRESAFELAQARLNAAVTFAELAALPLIAADGLRNLGIIAAYQSDYVRAQNYFAQNLRIYQQLGNLPSEAAALGNLGVLAIYQSDYAAAQPYLEQSVAIFRKIGDRRSEAIGLNNLGTIAHKGQDYAQAQACFEQTIVISHQIDDLQSRREAHNLWGHLLSEQAQHTAAKQHYEIALQLAHEIHAPGSIIESQAGLAAAAFAAGDSAGAYALVQKFMGDIDERALAQTEDSLRVYLTCYQILRACGDARASQLIETAHRILQERAAKTPNAAIRRAFLQHIPVHRHIVAEFVTDRGALR